MEINEIKNIPYSGEYEQTFLGAQLVDDRVNETLNLLDVDDFYFEQHQVIFRAMKLLYMAKNPIDIVSVFDAIPQKQRNKVGGISYIAKLAASVPNTANTEYYAKRIKEMGLCRKGIKMADEMREVLENGELDKAREIAAKAAMLAAPDTEKAFSDLFDEQEFERLASRRIWESDHLPTFTEYLPVTLGEVDVIAGRTSTGKTQIALNLALDFLKQGAKVGYLSLEMVKSQMLRRLIAYYNNQELYSVDLRNRETQKKAKEILKKPELKNFRFRDDLMDINDMIAWTLVTKPDILILDYMQLIEDKFAGKDEYTRLTNVADKIRKYLSRITAVILMSQMNRKDASRDDLSKINGTGRIEHVATGIIFIERAIDDPKVIRYRILKNQSNGRLTDWSELQLQKNGELTEDVPII